MNRHQFRKVRRLRPRYFAMASAALLVAGFVVGGAAAAPARAAGTSITVDGTQSGRTFDGIGALSAGANSRLLFDYPEPQRSQILDYLFKPGYGANLQILKVEVGGDTNSTDGAEPSTKHSASDADYNRGYEWWLMEQAKARNPAVKISALAWGAPGWVGVNDPNNPNPGQPYFWSADMINYYVDWIKHAQSDHGITVDTIGGWNERGFDFFSDSTTQARMKAWYEGFHQALSAANLPTKIIADDGFSWKVADVVAADPAFAASVDILGQHYTCGYLTAMNSCPPSTAAVNGGKTLWASENGSQDLDAGAPVAKAINRGYLDAKTTAFINWPPIASIYPDLPWARTGLMLADQPWSGAYQIGNSLWATAHTTQFAAPGWHYIDSASGYLSGSGLNSDPHSGSYDTLASPNGKDYSTIFETLDAGAAQTVTVNVTGGLSTGTVHVWSSDFTNGTYFTQQSDITPSQTGSYSLTLQPGRIYSFTTTTGQGHGTAVGNAPATLALPYTDNFDEYQVGKEPRYLADMQGSFETVACGGGRSGICVRQMAPATPLIWWSGGEPNALLGDTTWTDYTVASDVLFEQNASAELIARAGRQGSGPANLNGYYLVVGSDGTWSILRNTWQGTRTVLRSGTTTAPGTGTWHRLSLTVQGSTLTAALDGTTLGSTTDSTYRNGQIGIGTGGYQGVQFDNLAITPLGADYGQTWSTISNANSGKDLEVPAGSTVDGAGVDQWTDTGAAWEQWALVADGSGYVKVVNRNSGKLLEDPGWSTTAGSGLDQWSDAGSSNEQWQAQQNADGSTSLTNRYNGLVADVSGASTADGAPVIQWTANGGANQRWNVRPVLTPGYAYAIVNRASGKTLEVPGGSTTDGTKVDQWSYDNSAWEQWKAVATDSGYIKLLNVNSGKALDDTGASTVANNPLEQWTDIGATNEQWKLVPAGDGYFTLVNRLSGLAATATGTGDGASIVQAQPAGTASQWSLFRL